MQAANSCSPSPSVDGSWMPALSQTRVSFTPLGKPNAIRHGASLATGDYILLTHAAAEHAPGGLAAAVRGMEEHQLALLVTHA